MLVGDLCLSVIPANTGDSGLFAREAYISGGFDARRLPLLLATGLLGMALGFFFGACLPYAGQAAISKDARGDPRRRRDLLKLCCSAALPDRQSCRLDEQLCFCP